MPLIFIKFLCVSFDGRISDWSNIFCGITSPEKFADTVLLLTPQSSMAGSYHPYMEPPFKNVIWILFSAHLTKVEIVRFFINLENVFKVSGCLIRLPWLFKSVLQQDTSLLTYTNIFSAMWLTWPNTTHYTAVICLAPFKLLTFVLNLHSSLVLRLLIQCCHQIFFRAVPITIIVSIILVFSRKVVLLYARLMTTMKCWNKEASTTSNGSTFLQVIT